MQESRYEPPPNTRIIVSPRVRVVKHVLLVTDWMGLVRVRLKSSQQAFDGGVMIDRVTHLFVPPPPSPARLLEPSFLSP